MEINHKLIETILLSWAAETSQAHVAKAITEEYHRQGGGPLHLVPGKNWNNQQNIFHRWLDCSTPKRREKMRLLLPAILVALPRTMRHRLNIWDSLERRALMAAQEALGKAMDAHDDAQEAIYREVLRNSSASPQSYH